MIVRSIFMFLIPLLVGAGPLPAQTPPPAETVPTVPSGRQFSSATGTAEDALEGAVGSKDYRLGPGDHLALNLWGETPVAFDLVVSLQGTLLVPQVGEVGVDGLTLAEADARIGRALDRRYRNQKHSLTLVQLRRFPVHVTGRVVQPGTVLATALDRVLDAIARALGAQEDAGLRRVRITHADGTVTRADLLRYINTGEAEHNPLLSDGDVINVPFRGPEVHLFGAVHAPGSYEFTPEDTLEDLLRLAGGLTTDARRDTVEIVRYTTPTATERLILPFEGTGKAFVAAAEQVPLEAGDQVFIRRRLDYKRRYLVDVRGEVQFPGKFAVAPGETRLSQVIERAGGFTDQAFLREATVTRRRSVQLEDKEYERLRQLSRADMTDEEYSYFKMKSREEKGRMVVDFVALFVDGDQDQDIVLQDGDIVEVPRGKNFVSVLGEVASPGNIIRRGGMTLEDYIRAAGGYSDRANKGKVRVIRVASGEWVKAGEVRDLQAGDTIWVPDKPQRDYWQIFRDTLGVVTQILTVYLIVDRAIVN